MLNEWKQWDRHPSGSFEARRLEGAADVEAEQLGITTTDLRVMLSELRRAGVSHEDALEHLKKVVALEFCSD